MSDSPAVGRERRERGSVPIVSPFQGVEARKSPLWWERIRGVVGMGVVIVLAGTVVAAMFAFSLVALAIFVATQLN